MLDKATEEQRLAREAAARAEAERAEAERLAQEATRLVQEQIAASKRLVQEQIAASKVPLRDTMRTNNGAGPELVRITGGRFWYCDGTCNWIKIAPFAISKFEITRAEFRRFVKATRYRTDARRRPKLGCNTQIESGIGMRNSFDWLRPSYEQTEEHPVVCVSINDALEYTKWLSLETGHSYRLPYEAEWDFAFYSGSKYAAGFKLPGGGEYNPSPVLKDVLSDSRHIDECALGNFGTQPSDLAGCYGPHRYSVPVGSYSPNRVGIYDMFGNVQEITLTCAFTRSGDGKRLDADNPSGDVPFQRVPGCAEIGVKGGGFYLGFTHWLEVKPRSWTGDYGEYYYARNSSAGVGFRVVRDL